VGRGKNMGKKNGLREGENWRVESMAAGKDSELLYRM